MSPRPRFRRRARHHLLLAAGSLAIGVAAGALLPADDLRTAFSIGTAYASLACIAASLMLGPVNLLRGRPNPVSTDLRRDLGIWGAVLGLVHVGFGLTVHFRGRMALYFLPPPEQASALPLRLDAFGLANYAGVVAGVVLLGLLALSNDVALRRLGATRWKRWQRFNYLGALAIVGHGVLYQLLERRRMVLAVTFAALVTAAAVVQGMGFRRYRRSAREVPQP